VRALILAAGLGTRLRPLTWVRAKAAVPVNGTSLVGRAISWLVAEGIDDLVVNLHHHPASIARIVGDGGAFAARVRYSWEHPVLGSAGGPRRALPLLVDDPSGDDSFLMVNGDTLTSLSLRDFVAAHRGSGALVTMALIENPRPDIYGGVQVEDGWVRGFTRPGSGGPSYHFIGVQAARARAFAGLEDGVPAESVMGLYPRLIGENPRAVQGYVVKAPFADIGTPADYLQTSLQLAATEGDRLVGMRDISIESSATVNRTAVWDRVTIGKNCTLEECIVCDGVRVPDGASYRRTAMVAYAGQPVQKDERVEDGLLLRPF
jgi:NDP-sugar pyrophosphorylase family protein